jgi:hypothetical protein
VLDRAECAVAAHDIDCHCGVVFRAERGRHGPTTLELADTVGLQRAQQRRNQTERATLPEIAAYGVGTITCILSVIGWSDLDVNGIAGRDLQL